MATPELIEAFESVYELASQNALDTKGDDHGDEALNSMAIDQRKKLNRVRRFIDNIKNEVKSGLPATYEAIGPVDLKGKVIGYNLSDDTFVIAIAGLGVKTVEAQYVGDGCCDDPTDLIDQIVIINGPI